MSVIAKIHSSIFRRYALCFILLIANIIGFIYQSYYIQDVGGSWLSPSDEDSYTLIELGANVVQLTLTGEPWRLVTNIFLHAGLSHFLFNMVALISIGVYAEEHFGKLKMLAIYLLSGIAASLLSTLWYNNASQGNDLYGSISYSVFHTQILRVNISMGASGAIMGLAGANLVTMLIKVSNANDVADPEQKKYLISTLVMVGLTLFYGLKGGVDNAAHIGGLISGAIVSAVLLGCCSFKSPAIRTISSLISITALAGLLFSVIQATQHPESGEMLNERKIILNKLIESQQAKKLEQQRSLAELQIVQDRKALPEPASEEVASGIHIAIGDYPEGMYQTPDGRWLYVSDGNSNQVIQIDLQKNKKVRTYSAPSLSKPNDGCSSNMCRGIGASGIAASPDNKLIYVTSMQPNALSVIDAESGKIVKTLPLGEFPRSILLTHDGKRVYVMNSLDNTISVVDLQHYAVEKVITFPGGTAEDYAFGRPLVLALSPDEKWLAVANPLALTVQLINTQTLESLAIPEGDMTFSNVQSLRFSADNMQLWIVADNSLIAMNIPSRKITQQIQSCQGQELKSATLNSDATLLAVQSPGTDRLLLVKIATRSVIGDYPLTIAGYGIEFSNNGSRLLSKNQEGITVLNRDQSLDVRNTGITPLCFEDPNKKDEIDW